MGASLGVQSVSLQRMHHVRCHGLAHSAGYAADGYARAKGVGCCVVTFTVGGLSAINAIAGADPLPCTAQLRCTPATCYSTGVATAMRRVPTSMRAATPHAHQTVSLPPTLTATKSTGRCLCREPAPHLHLWRAGEHFNPTCIWPGTAQRAGCRGAWGHAALSVDHQLVICASVYRRILCISISVRCAPLLPRPSSSAALLYECSQTEPLCRAPNPRTELQRLRKQPPHSPHPGPQV